MKKEDYLQMLQENLKSLARRLGLGPSWVFQSNNDLKHTSKEVKERLNQAWIEALEWLSQSHDLNPIENMWTVLNKQVCARKPTNYYSARRLHEAWGWLSKAPNWRENDQGTFNLKLEWLYVFEPADLVIFSEDL